MGGWSTISSSSPTSNSLWPRTAASCEVTAFAIIRQLFRVELEWDSGATDLDLHLLNAAGNAAPWSSNGWFSLTNDCYYLNRTPDWGVAVNAVDAVDRRVTAGSNRFHISATVLY